MALAIGTALAVRGDGIYLAEFSGLARPAPRRLGRIVEATAAGAGREAPELWLLTWHDERVAACVASDKMMFAADAVATLDDGELAAVAAREIARLAEPNRLAARRAIAGISLCGMALASLIHGAYGGWAALVYGAAVVVWTRWSVRGRVAPPYDRPLRAAAPLAAVRNEKRADGVTAGPKTM